MAEPSSLDLSQHRRIHVVGMGGAGMSAIATVLAAMGHDVSGSDLKPSVSLERLRALGVRAVVGHAADNIGDADLLTVSTAIPAGNVEVREAERRGIPILRRAEILSAITATRRTVAVAGTHGKTTTASMLALILVEAGLRPSFIIGGDINDVGAGAVWSDGDWLVVEADESDGTFLQLVRDAAVVTSIEPDHLDFYGDPVGVERAFRDFLAGTSGVRVACADDPVAARLGRDAGALLYGTEPGAGYRMVEAGGDRSSGWFTVVHAGGDGTLGRVTLAVPGLHNARNACGALVTALSLGVDFDTARRALARYGGVARRFEFRGERDGVTFVDDYAHLPTEVAAALATARSGGWPRIVCVFQPHRYSRTASLWQSFAGAFEGADELVVTDIYSAGEAPRPGVTGKLIANAVIDAHPGRAVRYLPDRTELLAFLRRELRPGDLCLTLGAGDLTLLPSELLGETA